MPSTPQKNQHLQSAPASSSQSRANVARLDLPHGYRKLSINLKPKRQTMMTRRIAIQKTALVTAALAVGTQLSPAQAQSAAAPTGPFHLDPLPYPFDALEPHIDAQTMQIHHDKHHAAYVTNLNKAMIDQPDLAKKSAAELISNLSAVPEKIRAAVRNNGGGHVNHTFFWKLMARGAGGEPKGDLAKAIENKFGGFDKFKTEFGNAAMTRFGSGWAWLTVGPGKQLEISSSPNQDSPWTSDSLAAEVDKLFEARYGRGTSTPAKAQPILALDVWEHAYYLKYQNRRADYVAAFFNVINWDFVAEQFAKAV